jgi:hypothetical protein
VAAAAFPELRRPAEEVAREAVPPRFRFVNDTLAPTATLLFVNTNRGFFCRRSYLADSFFEASQVALLMAPAETPEDLARRLRARGISHLLVAADDWGISYPQAFWDLLSDAEATVPLFTSADGRYRILKLPEHRPVASPTPAHRTEAAGEQGPGTPRTPQ